VSSAAPIRVPPEQLRWRCDAAGFDTLGDAVEDVGAFGQERALEALHFGLEVEAAGYHVFVAGLAGTGRIALVRRLLERLSDRQAIVTDKAYVHNFEDPSRPRLLQLPAGRIRAFAQRMDELASELLVRLEALGEDAQHWKRRRRLGEALSEASTRELEQLTEAARAEGFSIFEVKEHGFTRPALGFAHEDEVFPVEALRLLHQQGRIDAAEAERLEERARPLRDRVERVAFTLRRSARRLARELRQFDRDQARTVVHPELEEIAAEFTHPAVRAQLDALEKWILDHCDRARGGVFARALRKRLTVNVLVDASARQETPIVFPPAPTLAELFGTIKTRTTRTGFAVADHRQVRAGSLLRADGGYLLLRAEELLAEEGAWPALKRALKLGRTEIPPREAGALPVALQPEPIPLRVKVVLIGDPDHLGQFEQTDPEFRKLFKVVAEFEDPIPRTPANVSRFAAFLRQVAREERLPPPTSAALAAAVEAAARRAGIGGRLSTRLDVLNDLMREAALFALRDGARAIDAVHIDGALAASRRREDLIEREHFAQLRDGLLLVSVDGERVGQINALTVSTSGDHAFGRPSRVTATAAAGDHGILNLEREVELSGGIHDKGVLILAGFLRERFGQSHPLSLVASLCFEQNYGPIDGDSASLAELYALLSALAQVPLRQGIAVTGSVNQKGDVQPVGSVNEKIEGFFDACALLGLSGRQGVVIPRRNLDDLMLAPRVIDAVRAGRFEVWAIDRVDDALELLTGLPAGELGDDDRYPPGSVNARVAEHLWFLAEVARDFKGAQDGAAEKPVAPAAPHGTVLDPGGDPRPGPPPP
jgi:lon-related putative ATP-dependent protease